MDGALDGGWPVGALAELRGRGRTSVGLAAVRSAQERDLPVAWIDGSRTFCPGTASVDLDRLTLVRPQRGPREPASRRSSRSPRGQGPSRHRSFGSRALFASDLLLRSRAFALVVLDMPSGSTPLSAWFRLARLAARGRTWLLVLHGAGRPIAGSAARLAISLRLVPDERPPWVELSAPAMEVTVVRHRSSADGRRLVLPPRADARAEHS